jgi:glycine/D-amino acid oxidase-like deaminating enzyme
MNYYDSDIVVVGDGIMGAFTALRLAQRNRTVFLLDKGKIGRESTGRCGGGVRQQYRDPAELPLAMKAVNIWAAQLCRSLGLDLPCTVRKSQLLITDHQRIYQL